MHLPGEANKGAVSPIAIVGAALRFPGAADPAEFHELTVSGLRMFQDIAHIDRVTARYLLAADAGAAALADVPAAGRPSRSGRTGVIIADTAKPGVPDVAGWVRGRLGLADPGTGHGAHTCSLRAIADACDRLNSGQLDLVLAGGVSMGIEPAWLAYRAHYRADASAPAVADVRVYDVSPSGALPGEGCGIIALMRTADARAAGLPVYAEIAGWHAADDDDAQAAIRGACAPGPPWRWPPRKDPASMWWPARPLTSASSRSRPARLGSTWRC